MALKPPPGSSGSNTSLITNTVVPLHTQTQQFSAFSLFQILLSPPYVYIFMNDLRKDTYTTMNTTTITARAMKM